MGIKQLSLFDSRKTKEEITSGDYRKPLFVMSKEDKEFARTCSERGFFPPEFLMEMRVKRRNWTRLFFVSLPVYERNRELADEMAIITLPNTEYIRPYDPDPKSLDDMARRWARERCEAFQRFLQAEKEKGFRNAKDAY